MDFYYDTLSPFSWLAFEILQRYKPVWNLHINYIPVLQPGLAKMSKNSVIDSYKCSNKFDYTMSDMERTARYFQVPLRVPESPMYLLGVAGSLKQQRFLTAVKKHYPDLLESASREFWYRCWSEDMDATKESSMIVVGNRAGLSDEEIAHVLEEMSKDEIKNELKSCTKRAVEEGAFGVPFMVVHHSDSNVETFFGSDRFEVLADTLRLKWFGPIPDADQFTPLAPPPDNQQELFEKLEKAGAVSIEVPEEAKEILRAPAAAPETSSTNGDEKSNSPPKE